MAFTGSQIDHAVRKFTDMLDFELQQRGSRLRGVVRNEVGMGDTVYFDRLGTVSSYQRTGRNEPKQIADQTFERRLVSPTTIEFNTTIDLMDLIRYSSSPQSDLMVAARAQLGRNMDDIIISAMIGTAGRQVNGATSNVAFDTANQQVADTYVGFTSGTLTGSTMLHEGKIIKAKQILQDNELDMDAEQLYVVGNAKQFSFLESRLTATNIAFRTDMGDTNLPGVDKALDGVYGIRFIHSTRIPQSSSLDQVLMFVPSSVKFGIWQDLNVNVHKRYDLASNPDEITMNFTVGAVRMDEKKIVSILNATS